MQGKRWSVGVLVLLQALACGGDDDSEAQGGAAEGGSAPVTAEPGTVPCGAMRCRPPDGFTGEACCKDTFSATCGLKIAADMCSTPPPQKEPNCPDGTLAYGEQILFARGCCIPDTDECGLNLVFTQIPGIEIPDNCESLADVTSFGGSSDETSVMTSVPPPTHCDGSPIE